MEHDFEKESLYAVLSEKDSVKVYYVKRLAEAVEATSDDAEKLNMKKENRFYISKPWGAMPLGNP